MSLRRGDTGSVSRGRRSLTPQPGPRYTSPARQAIPLPPGFEGPGVLPEPSVVDVGPGAAHANLHYSPLPVTPTVRAPLPASFPSPPVEVPSPAVLQPSPSVVEAVHSPYAVSPLHPTGVALGSPYRALSACSASPPAVNVALRAAPPRPVVAHDAYTGGAGYAAAVQESEFAAALPHPIVSPAIPQPHPAIPVGAVDERHQGVVALSPPEVGSMPAVADMQQAAADAAADAAVLASIAAVPGSSPMPHPQERAGSPYSTTDYALKRQHPKQLGGGRATSTPRGTPSHQGHRAARGEAHPAWVRFSSLAESNGIEAHDLGLLFWDTVEQLCRHFGIADPIDLAIIQAEWRRCHTSDPSAPLCAAPAPSLEPSGVCAAPPDHLTPAAGLALPHEATPRAFSPDSYAPSPATPRRSVLCAARSPSPGGRSAAPTRYWSSRVRSDSQKNR